MRFLNKETKTILEVDDKNKDRITKLKGYPDKFEVIQDDKKDSENKTQKGAKKDDKKDSENKVD